MQRLIALVAAIAGFVVALFLPGAAAVETPWIEGFGAWFALDPAGAAGPLLLAVALVMIPTVLHASQQVERNAGAFLALLFATQAGLVGLFMAAHLRPAGDRAAPQGRA